MRSRKQFLVAISVVLLIAAATVGAVSTGAFTTVNTGRDANVGVASGSDALLGLDIAQSVPLHTRSRMFTVTNNLGSTATITVSLLSPNAGTLYMSGQSGPTVSFTLISGNSKIVELDAVRKGTIPFEIKGIWDQTTVTATRRISVEQTGPIAIPIDIKPGSDRNPINPDSKGVTPVAILHTDAFDPTTRVDVDTLRFGDPDDVTIDTNAGAFPAHGGHVKDVDDDGDADLVLHFPTMQTGFDGDDETGVVVGKTNDGTAIKGTDSVTIVDGKHDDKDGNEYMDGEDGDD